MSKSRLVSGRIKKVTGDELSAARYEYLDLANAEPDLGLPAVDESVLVGDVDGSRTWVDIATYADEFKGYTGSQGDTGFTGSAGATGFTGSQGDVGFTGSAGVDGAGGTDGTPGFTGSQGPQGNFGGVTFDYTFDSATDDADPGAGKLRLNNAAAVSALQLYIHDTDDANANLDAYLTTIDDSTSQLKGHVRISNKADSNDFAIFSITGVSTNNTTYFTVPVAYVSGTATGFDNLEDIIVTFARTGDKGDIGFTGSQGIVGFTGSQGLTGFTGSAGVDGVIGSDGAQGAVGFTGSQGNQGDIGYTGSQGFLGSTGFTGSKGELGYTGSKGDIGLEPWKVINSDYTAGNRDRLIANSTAGSFNITLPETPAVGDYIQITDGANFNLYPITILRNGNTIEGFSENVLLDLPGSTFEFIYDGATWQITSTTGPQGFTGSAGADGTIGVDGAPGEIGFTGSQGIPGEFAALGYTGSQGDIGFTGSGGNTLLERHYRRTGRLTVEPGFEKWYIPADSVINSIKARVEVAPVGGDTGIVIAVKIYDSILNTVTQTVNLTINNTEKVSALYSDAIAVLSTDYVIVDVLNIGTTVAGEDLTVTFTYLRS